MFLLAMAAMAAVSADSALGRWQTESRHGVVEIAPCGRSICGTLMTSDGIRANPNLTDLKNADTAKRGRPLKGITMLSGFSRDGAGWSGGTIYNPENGKTYTSTVTPEDANHLKVRGCIFVPLCKTQNWTRLP
jgi:uncharacterized protein (DUF2147 family)